MRDLGRSPDMMREMFSEPHGDWVDAKGLCRNCNVLKDGYYHPVKCEGCDIMDDYLDKMDKGYYHG